MLSKDLLRSASHDHLAVARLKCFYAVCIAVERSTAPANTNLDVSPLQAIRSIFLLNLERRVVESIRAFFQVVGSDMAKEQNKVTMRIRIWSL